MQEVKDYLDYIKPHRANKKPDGFDFDMDQFENLVDAFASEDEILTILRVKRVDMDRFCNICYDGLCFRDTYNLLSGITHVYFKKAMKGLAKAGNSTALSLTAKHMMGMRDDDENKNANVNITFSNDLVTKSDNDGEKN